MARRILWLFFATALLLMVNGCTRVIHATTEEPIRPDPASTSIGTDIDDWQMETLIGVNIKKASPELENAHINIHAYNQVILLTGEVVREDLRTLAGQTARGFRGVRQVYNEIQIRGTSSFLSRSNDLWISTKVKAKLIANSNIKSTQIKVITENGIIYLMGIATRQVADHAARIASTTSGAQKVVKAFEYLD